MLLSIWNNYQIDSTKSDDKTHRKKRVKKEWDTGNIIFVRKVSFYWIDASDRFISRPISTTVLMASLFDASRATVFQTEIYFKKI